MDRRGRLIGRKGRQIGDSMLETELDALHSLAHTLLRKMYPGVWNAISQGLEGIIRPREL